MHAGVSTSLVHLGPEVGIADGADEVLKAVRYQIKRGARVIKISATAGVTWALRRNNGMTATMVTMTSGNAPHIDAEHGEDAEKEACATILVRWTQMETAQ
jgi:hypothetical protein